MLAAAPVSAVNPPHRGLTVKKDIMPTYEDVQEYTRKHYGWVAQGCWIAHVKEIRALPLRKSKRGDAARVKPCPPDKQAQVEAAMRAVGML